MHDRDVLVTGALITAAFVVLQPASMAFVDARVNEFDLNRRPLHDVSTELLPDLSRWYWVGDAMTYLFCAVITACMLRTGRGSLLLRIVWLSIVANAFKILLNAVTIHPDPSGECHTRERGWMKSFVGSCNWLMPSGHMLIPLATLFMTYGNIPPALWWSASAYTAALSFVTVASRNHYTIDVLVSLFVVGTLAPAMR